MATLLQIVQEFCGRTGLTKPNIVMSSQDDQLLQIAGLANEVCSDIVRRASWQVLQFETTFQSVVGEDQGAIADLAPNAFLKVTNDTIYDRTRRLPVLGPRSAQNWQALKALPMSGPLYQYRIRNGRLLILPAMPEGHLMAFEYTSQGAVIDAASAIPLFKEYFEKDEDTFALDKNLVLLGLRWRWKEEKGLPYLESFRLYESAVAEASGSDATSPTLNMSNGTPTFLPGVFVPAGSWNV